LKVIVSRKVRAIRKIAIELGSGVLEFGLELGVTGVSNEISSLDGAWLNSSLLDELF
jgi:hypothetical protein